MSANCKHCGYRVVPDHQCPIYKEGDLVTIVHQGISVGTGATVMDVEGDIVKLLVPGWESHFGTHKFAFGNVWKGGASTPSARSSSRPFTR